MGCGVLASPAMVLMLEFIVLVFMSFSKGTVAYDYITCISILFLKKYQCLQNYKTCHA